jgi:hypothetical protein
MADFFLNSMAGWRAAFGNNVLLNPEVLQSSAVNTGDLRRCLDSSPDEAGRSPAGGTGLLRDGSGSFGVNMGCLMSSAQSGHETGFPYLFRPFSSLIVPIPTTDDNPSIVLVLTRAVLLTDQYLVLCPSGLTQL